jgi:HAMP domain-containing protein
MEEKMESSITQGINSVTLEELLQVKGMNDKLAERIIAGQPYADLSAIKAIKGMKLPMYQVLEKRFVANDSTLQEERAEPQVELAMVEIPVEVEPPATLPEEKPLEVLPPEPEVKKTPVVAETSVRQPGGPGQRSIPGRLEMYLMIGAGLFLGVVLSLVLSLGILYLVNNTLVFAPADKISALESRIDQVQNDLRVLQERVSAIEDLSGRVAGLEQQTEAFGKDLDAIDQQLVRIKQTVTDIQQRARIFDTFLGGLRSLLESLPMQESGQ